MTRKEAMALARRIEREDEQDQGGKVIEARDVQIGRDTGFYLVAILFLDSDAGLILRHEGEWDFLRSLRNMSPEERAAIHEMKMRERHGCVNWREKLEELRA